MQCFFFFRIKVRKIVARVLIVHKTWRFVSVNCRFSHREILILIKIDFATSVEYETCSEMRRTIEVCLMFILFMLLIIIAIIHFHRLFSHCKQYRINEELKTKQSHFHTWTLLSCRQSTLQSCREPAVD